MSEQHHGGASQSTEPAAGSSSATDVSLREYTSRDAYWLDRHFTAEIASLRRETHAATNAERAVGVAADEASERLKAHNGLIEQMRAQAEHFASRDALDDAKEASNRRLEKVERFQAALVGGMIIVSAIGVANLVKVFTG